MNALLPTLPGLGFVDGTVPTAISNRGEVAGVCGHGGGITFGLARQINGTITVFDRNRFLTHRGGHWPSTRAAKSRVFTWNGSRLPFTVAFSVKLKERSQRLTRRAPVQCQIRDQHSRLQ
jgi:hypothetical protein